METTKSTIRPLVMDPEVLKTIVTSQYLGPNVIPGLRDASDELFEEAQAWVERIGHSLNLTAEETRDKLIEEKVLKEMSKLNYELDDIESLKNYADKLGLADVTILRDHEEPTNKSKTYH